MKTAPTASSIALSQGNGFAISVSSPSGGSGNDEGWSVQQTTDGGYILLGYSWSSTSGDVTGTNHGWQDYWVVKLAGGTPPVALPGGAGIPADTNGDGKYDDVNGNGRKDFADVVLYFNQMTWIAGNEPLEAFDYNGNGRIDFAGVLFWGASSAPEVTCGRRRETPQASRTREAAAQPSRRLS